jgi:hypothetical protein
MCSLFCCAMLRISDPYSSVLGPDEQVAGDHTNDQRPLSPSPSATRAPSLTVARASNGKKDAICFPRDDEKYD